jgi:cell division protein FtsB
MEIILKLLKQTQLKIAQNQKEIEGLKELETKLQQEIKK